MSDAEELVSMVTIVRYTLIVLKSRASPNMKHLQRTARLNVAFGRVFLCAMRRLVVTSLGFILFF